MVEHHRHRHLPAATRLLITADSGGSNGSRLRLWKTELAALATETGLAITVCHLPPGTSKWNKIEHRLFSAISRSWRARPLTSHEVVIETIRATTTTTGLTVKAELDLGTYEKGIKISDQQIKDLETTQLHRHEFHRGLELHHAPRDTPEHTHLNLRVLAALDLAVDIGTNKPRVADLSAGSDQDRGLDLDEVLSDYTNRDQR